MQPVITVASDPFCGGEGVVAAAASRLGFGRVEDEVFAAAAARAGADAEAVLGAIRRPPALLGMTIRRRKRFLAALGASIAEALLPGGVIYHGPAGHHFVRGISHVIRAKITASTGDRARRKVAAEGGSEARAVRDVEAADERRMRTCREVFGEDCGDPALYDVHVSTSDVSAAVAADRLVAAAAARKYQPQTWSIASLGNLATTWRVRSALSEIDPDVLVRVEEGRVLLRTRLAESPDSRTCREMREKVQGLPGIAEVTVETSEDLFGGRGRLLR